MGRFKIRVLRVFFFTLFQRKCVKPLTSVSKRNVAKKKKERQIQSIISNFYETIAFKEIGWQWPALFCSTTPKKNVIQKLHKAFI